jgi:hypothetical protein
MRRSLLIVLLFVVAGCNGKGAQTGKGPYTGPTLPMYEVVQRINQNNSKVTSLWASNEMDASIVDDKGDRHNEVLSGSLLYRPQRDMLIVATKPAIGRVFEIGSNDDVYWMSIKVGPDTAWWGHYRNLGKPCAQPIPIRPDLILQVLGVSVIGQDFNQVPVPVMRFNPDSDAYMFVWNGKLPDRWVAVKEVWYDRQTLTPRLVLLFDENGRVVLRAYLSDHQKVKVADLPEIQWPVVARNFRLYFPENGSKLVMNLTDVGLTGPKNVPNERSFKFDPERTRTSKVIQLDEACGG